MATPYGHSLAGIIIYLVFNKIKIQDNWGKVALYIIAANLPDLDFIPGIIIGEPDKFHHRISHSLGFSMLFAGIIWGYSWLRSERNIVQIFIVSFCLYFSHIFIDWFTLDSAFPYGEPFWWPLSYQYYISSIAILPDVRRHNLSSMSTITHNIWAMLIETILFLPIILFIQYVRQRSKKSHTR